MQPHRADAVGALEPIRLKLPANARALGKRAEPYRRT
jgi:hypothetical protein